MSGLSEVNALSADEGLSSSKTREPERVKCYRFVCCKAWKRSIVLSPSFVSPLGFDVQDFLNCVNNRLIKGRALKQESRKCSQLSTCAVKFMPRSPFACLQFWSMTRRMEKMVCLSRMTVTHWAWMCVFAHYSCASLLCCRRDDTHPWVSHFRWLIISCACLKHREPRWHSIEHLIQNPLLLFCSWSLQR